VGKPLSGNCCISVLYVAVASRNTLDLTFARKTQRKRGEWWCGKPEKQEKTKQRWWQKIEAKM